PSLLVAPRRPPTPTLFPYTTLFRSEGTQQGPHLLPAAADSVDHPAGCHGGGGDRHLRGRGAWPDRHLAHRLVGGVHDPPPGAVPDRKSTRLNSSHVKISYAVFCLKQ